MAADLEIFKCLYLFSLTSYGLITGLADFPFTEWCYWYLQSALNPCLKAAPLSVKKPDFPDFLQILFSFFLSSFFFKTSYNNMVKRRKKTFSADGIHGWVSAWLCGLTPFKLLLKWIQLIIVCCKLIPMVNALEQAMFTLIFWWPESDFPLWQTDWQQNDNQIT